jgi:tetratricopeptide (TPR) repeat protein
MRRVPVWFLLLAACGLALRFGLLVEHARSPFGLELFGDERATWARAGELLSGGWRTDGAFYQGPLYPYALAAARALLPGFGPTGLAAAQLGLNWLTCLLLVPAVAPWAGPTAGLGAAALALSFAPAAFFALKGMPTTLGLFLLVASFALLGPGARPRARAAVAGVLAGLAFLAVPSFLAAAPGLALLAARAAPPGRRFAPAALLALGAALAVSPAAVHNYRADGSLALISTNAGVTFANGNGPAAAGTYALVPGLSATASQNAREAVRVASLALGRPASQAEASGHFFRRGLSFVREQPGQWLLLELRKLGYLLAGLDVPLEYSLERERRDFLPLLWAFPVGGTAAVLFALFALAGPARRSAAAPLTLAALIGSVGLVFYAAGRYAYPAYFLALGAAPAGLEALFSPARRLRLLLPAAAVGSAVLFAAPALSGPTWEGDDYLWKLAGVYERLGRQRELGETFARWQRVSPDSPVLHHRMAAVAFRAGRMEEAEAAARRAVALYRGNPAADLLLCRILVATGRAGLAVARLETLVAADGLNDAARALLVEARARAAGGARPR